MSHGRLSGTFSSACRTSRPESSGARRARLGSQRVRIRVGVVGHAWVAEGSGIGDLRGGSLEHHPRHWLGAQWRGGRPSWRLEPRTAQSRQARPAWAQEPELAGVLPCLPAYLPVGRGQAGRLTMRGAPARLACASSALSDIMAKA